MRTAYFVLFKTIKMRIVQLLITYSTQIAITD